MKIFNSIGSWLTALDLATWAVIATVGLEGWAVDLPWIDGVDAVLTFVLILARQGDRR